MRHIILTVFFAIIPVVSFSGGHSGFGGKGTAVTIENEVMKGKSGVLVKNTSSDVWMWNNLPKGFPSTTSAQCTQFIAFATGQEQPIGFSFTCLSVDPEGDVSMSVGAPHKSGRALITQVAGTGKWEEYNGMQFLGGTDVQINETTSIYSWEPINKRKF